MQLLNPIKCLRADNKRLQSLVAKLTGTNETLGLQLKLKEEALTKRRIEVATLHQACAKYKQARAIAPIKRATPLTVPFTIKQAMPTAATTTTATTTTNSVCSHCQKLFGEMKETLKAQFDERLKTALKEKDGEIERLAAAMADKERKDEERRERKLQKKAKESQSADHYIEDTIRKMADIEQEQHRQLQQRLSVMDERYAQERRVAAERESQRQRESQQRIRVSEERHAEQVRLYELAVLRRRRIGVADAA